MALFPEINVDQVAADAEQALSTPLGFASPLWAAYAGMTGMGVAYWWLSQWTKPVNLEALSDMMGKYALVPKPELAVLEVPLLEAEVTLAAEDVAVEPPVETLSEAYEAAAETVTNAVEAAVEEAIPEPALLAAALEPETAAVEVVEETAPAIVEAAADDLTRLVGIGPTLAAKLYDLGVKRYSDIASWTEHDVERFDKTLSLLGRPTRDKWIDQAKQFAEAAVH